MAKTISICIPCYNSERYIRTTIESALGQTVPADEILISDDQSPDGSWAICREYEGVARVRVMRPPARTTLGGHYRFLLEHATSDFICFLSSDDAMMPHFVETMRRELEGEENVGLVTGACLETTSTLVPLKLRGAGTPKQALEAPGGFEYMKLGCRYTISFSLLSRRILIETPVIPRDGDLATDWCWAMMLGARGKMKFVHEPLGYYRIHATNAGHQNEATWQVACTKMLTFLRDYLGPPLGEELLPTLREVEHDVAKMQQGEAPGAPMTLKRRLGDLVKSLLARRYRTLPEHIVKAEAGIGVALLASRGRAGS